MTLGQLQVSPFGPWPQQDVVEPVEWRRAWATPALLYMGLCLSALPPPGGSVHVRPSLASASIGGERKEGGLVDSGRDLGEMIRPPQNNYKSP